MSDRLSISEIREFFVNPKEAESAQDLAVILAQVMLFLAQMYEGKEDLDACNDIVADNNSKLLDTVRDLLKREMKTIKFDHKFMGQIHPQGNKIGIISKAIAGFLNNNTVVREVSPVETEMEIEVTERIASWFGYDLERMSGNITSGGSEANLEAFWVAREKVKAKNPSVKKMYIIANEMAHYSVDKAADILGDNIEIIRVGVIGYKTNLDDLRRILSEIEEIPDHEVMAILGIAGETETGEVDDLQSMAQLAKEFDVYFHVDAAYGGPFVLSRQATIFEGISEADSITVDPHKMMYTSYSAGMVLFKNANDHHLIEKGMRERARYLIRTKGDGAISNNGGFRNSGDRNLGMARVSGSMGSEGAITTWSTLELLGEEGLAEILNHTLDLTQHAYHRVSKSKLLRALHKPELNTLLIGLNQEFFESNYDQIIKDMQRTCWENGYYISLNDEVDGGRAALRLVPMHPHTEMSEIDGLIDIMESTALVCINEIGTQHEYVSSNT